MSVVTWGWILLIGVVLASVSGTNALTKSALRQEVLILAHRGARSLAPENTLAAAYAAWRVGADGWEFDVRLTADGQPVLIHDEALTRTTNARDVFPNRSPWRVDQFTLEEIRRLDAGSWFVQQDPYGTLTSGEVPAELAQTFVGEKVPTLHEALTLTRELDLFANIELKSSTFFLSPSDKLLVERVVDLIRELNMQDRVIVSSFNHEMIRYLKGLAPEIAGALLVLSWPGDPATYVHSRGAQAINPSLSAYTPQMAQKVHQAGLGVYVWTVNAPEDLTRLASDPYVTGIITDWPQRLGALLGRKPRA